jgi:hypothetical protein
MKKIILALSLFLILLSLTQCNNPGVENNLNNAETRGKYISTLMSNDAYMNEVMDSMRTKHPDVILSSLFVIMKNNKQMQSGMMNQMMDMSKADSSMCRMMMDKTMDMADADQSKCDMMMGSMKSHPNVMKSIQGMCGMNGMKMKQMK